MYWIEVDFVNGKKLRKESEYLNDTYTVWTRFSDTSVRRLITVTGIRAGYGKSTTMTIDMLHGVVV